ncbi:Methylase involved in ubiquinone/menaquinone biosynthesis [uncultured Desulfobacterium sp.]|uniref:Methylase involved in ubiquinone/menaquinone biosynthesis n=1 Tax=uncultured Desulfobacterium sp. TaxID=201089 RepID=A0A445MXY1_9BACT|nr:Methylase involved in ubiquinone/menaquinone biosynthesis [uncultured Desulfobacterium sp.]
MATITENDLSSMLLDNFSIRAVEPHIYSVLPDNKCGNEYDSQFGFIYDLVACNPIYNRFIWGYSVKIFPQIANEALFSTYGGNVLDLGCGSLAFTANVYSQYTEHPVVLVDQSLKMLRMAKSRLMKQNGTVPENLVFIHADALQLPFQENTFTTILSENLLHCLKDTGILLKQLKTIISKNGRMYFTTLVRTNRFADRYLEALADSGKLVSRAVNDHKRVFEQIGLSAEYETTGNILIVRGNK